MLADRGELVAYAPLSDDVTAWLGTAAPIRADQARCGRCRPPASTRMARCDWVFGGRGDMSAVTGVLTVSGFGVVFAGLSGVKLVQARRLRGRGVTAEAMVVGQESTPVPGTSPGLMQQPILVFTTRDGETVRVTSPVGVNDTDLVPGYTVTIHYDPADPRRVSIPEHEVGVYRLGLAAGLFLLALVAAYGILGERLLKYGTFGIPVFLGAVFTGVGWYGIHRVRRLKRGGRTNGVVVGEVTTESRNGFTLYHPVARYRTPRGDVIDAPATQGHSYRLRPGTPVRVCYDPTNPQRMTLAGDSAAAVYWIFGVVGPLITVVGLVIIGAVLF